MMGRQSSDVVRFDLRPLLLGQTRVAKLKSSYNSLIIGTRVLECETNLLEILSWESSDVRFDLGGPSFKLKSAYNSLLICRRGFGCETNL